MIEQDAAIVSVAQRGEGGNIRCRSFRWYYPDQVRRYFSDQYVTPRSSLDTRQKKSIAAAARGDPLNTRLHSSIRYLDLGIAPWREKFVLRGSHCPYRKLYCVVDVDFPWWDGLDVRGRKGKSPASLAPTAFISRKRCRDVCRCPTNYMIH